MLHRFQSSVAILPRGAAILSCGAAILPRGAAILPRGAAILPRGAASPLLIKTLKCLPFPLRICMGCLPGSCLD
jgi:hypothetical protein